MSNPFSIETKQDGEITIVVLEGFVDAHTAPQFEDQVQQEIDNGNCKIVVDCANLTYISSAGLGVFMGFVEEAREQGGDIKIAGVVPKVLQVFDLLGFAIIYDIQNDVATAVQRFADGLVGPDEAEG